MEFRPWGEKQERALLSAKPIVLMACGVQAGKTTTGAMRLKLAMHTYTSSDDNFIVTAPTYKIMQQSTLPAFRKIMEGLGEYSKSEATFRMYSGGTAWFRTATDPDSIVGMTNVRHIWGDECGKYGLYFWENIQARAAFRQAPITLTTSPYTLNWIYKEFIKPAKRGNPREDCELIQAASYENPYFPREVYDKQKQTMDPRRFEMIYGGEWNKAAGLVYDCFEEDENIIEPFELPAGTKFYAGVDWGHRHPTAILVIAATPQGNYFLVSEVYKTNLTIHDIIAICLAKKKTWGIERFVCDPSQPGYIDAFNRHKLTAIPANNDIRYGIDVVYELIKTRRFKIFQGVAPHTVDELEMYHYPDEDDVKPDQHTKDPVPVKQHDDALDSLKYVLTNIYRMVDPRAPQRVDQVLPKHDIKRRIEMHKKNPFIGTARTEKWS